MTPYNSSCHGLIFPLFSKFPGIFLVYYLIISFRILDYPPMHFPVYMCTFMHTQSSDAHTHTVTRCAHMHTQLPGVHKHAHKVIRCLWHLQNIKLNISIFLYCLLIVYYLLFPAGCALNCKFGSHPPESDLCQRLQSFLWRIEEHIWSGFCIAPCLVGSRHLMSVFHINERMIGRIFRVKFVCKIMLSEMRIFNAH